MMELLPPVGWADVATKRDLDHLREVLELRFELLEERYATKDDLQNMQRWLIGLQVTTILALGGLIVGVG